MVLLTVAQMAGLTVVERTVGLMDRLLAAQWTDATEATLEYLRVAW